MGIIYKRTNLINGKVYIGQTIQDLQTRMTCENNGTQVISRAIKKYGKNNFKNEIIDVANTREELNEKEKYWIKFYDSTNPEKGYNRNAGGGCIGGGKKKYGSVVIWKSKKMLFPTKVSLIHYLFSLNPALKEHQAQSLLEKSLRLGQINFEACGETMILDLCKLRDYHGSIIDLIEYEK